MRILALLVALLLLAGAGGARWFAGPVAGTARRARDAGTEARLVGRGSAADSSAAKCERGIDDARRTGEITASIAGPPDRPHTLTDLQRLLAERDTEWEEGVADLESMLCDCEDHVVNELSLPCGVLLTGWEDGERSEVDKTPWIDTPTGRFEADFRTPYDVEALYVYGGRLVARAPLTDSGTHLVVDPRVVFAKTGGVELTVRLGDTGETVADVVLEIDAVHRDASTHADLALDGEDTVGVRPFRFPDLPAGVYHVRVERAGPPWTYGVATVEVRAGEVSRETITLGPGAAFCMRWFQSDGRPTGSRFTSVRLRDRENRLHEVPVRRTDADPCVLRVDRAPPGRCWLVTPDRRAHAVVPESAPPGPEHTIRLEEWVYVVLAVRLETLLPKPLAARARSHWIVRDDQGVIVEEDHMALTSDTRDDDGTFQGWAHLTPGRYHVRWQLTPDLAVEKDFEVPPEAEEIRIEFDPPGG